MLVSELPKEYNEEDWNQLTPALIKKILDGPVKQQAIDDYGKFWDEYWARLLPRGLLETVRGGSQS